jgi:hypothetical protein
MTRNDEIPNDKLAKNLCRKTRYSRIAMRNGVGVEQVVGIVGRNFRGATATVDGMALAVARRAISYAAI